jgi:hypothetical protein
MNVVLYFSLFVLDVRADIANGPFIFQEVWLYVVLNC